MSKPVLNLALSKPEILAILTALIIYEGMFDEKQQVEWRSMGTPEGTPHMSREELAAFIDHLTDLMDHPDRIDRKS